MLSSQWYNETERQHKLTLTNELCTVDKCSLYKLVDKQLARSPLDGRVDAVYRRRRRHALTSSISRHLVSGQATLPLPPAVSPMSCAEKTFTFFIHKLNKLFVYLLFVCYSYSLLIILCFSCVNNIIMHKIQQHKSQ